MTASFMSLPLMRTAMSVLQSQRVARARTLSKPEAIADGSADKVFRGLNGILERVPSGEVSRDRGGENTTGSVGIARANARRLKVKKLASIEENVDSGIAIQVPAFDQHRTSAHTVNLQRGFLHVSNACY